MENLVVLSGLLFIILTLAVLVFIAFNHLYKESRYLSDYGTDEQLKQRCSSHPVHNHHLLGLALEAVDYRTKEEATTDDDEKARYHESYSSVSTEVVDAVLALNGIDPHPGVILGGVEVEEDNTVVQFSDFKPSGDD